MQNLPMPDIQVSPKRAPAISKVMSAIITTGKSIMFPDRRITKKQKFPVIEVNAGFAQRLMHGRTVGEKPGGKPVVFSVQDACGNRTGHGFFLLMDSFLTLLLWLAQKPNGTSISSLAFRGLDD